jgi:hypothetical protein
VCEQAYYADCNDSRGLTTRSATSISTQPHPAMYGTFALKSYRKDLGNLYPIVDVYGSYILRHSHTVPVLLDQRPHRNKSKVRFAAKLLYLLIKLSSHME